MKAIYRTDTMREQIATSKISLTSITDQLVACSALLIYLCLNASAMYFHVINFHIYR